MIKTKKSRLIIISAPSGAGKTTLCEMLIKEFPFVGLSISTTTRAKRHYEAEGVHYHFVDRYNFEKMEAAGEFAEWAEVHGELYGTSKRQINQKLDNGQHVLFDIDIQGAMNLKRQYKERVLLIFIHPPSMEVLQERLVQRDGEDGASLETRLQNAYTELEQSKSFDYQITNDDLAKAYQKLKEIVITECQ